MTERTLTLREAWDAVDPERFEEYWKVDGWLARQMSIADDLERER